MVREGQRATACMLVSHRCDMYLRSRTSMLRTLCFKARLRMRAADHLLFCRVRPVEAVAPVDLTAGDYALCTMDVSMLHVPRFVTADHANKAVYLETGCVPYLVSTGRYHLKSRHETPNIPYSPREEKCFLRMRTLGRIHATRETRHCPAEQVNQRMDGYFAQTTPRSCSHRCASPARCHARWCTSSDLPDRWPDMNGQSSLGTSAKSAMLSGRRVLKQLL